jgi:hypothetical protein
MQEPWAAPASALGDAHIFFEMLKYGDFSGNPINRHPDESQDPETQRRVSFQDVARLDPGSSPG